MIKRVWSSTINCTAAGITVYHFCATQVNSTAEYLFPNTPLRKCRPRGLYFHGSGNTTTGIQTVTNFLTSVGCRFTSNISSERLNRVHRLDAHHLYLQEETVCNHLQTNGQQQQNVYRELNRYCCDLQSSDSILGGKRCGDLTGFQNLDTKFK